MLSILNNSAVVSVSAYLVLGLGIYNKFFRKFKKVK